MSLQRRWIKKMFLIFLPLKLSRPPSAAEKRPHPAEKHLTVREESCTEGETDVRDNFFEFSFSN
jgi:hypothetical protein